LVPPLLQLFDGNYNCHGNGNPNNDKRQIAVLGRNTRIPLTTANGKFCFVQIVAVYLSWKRKKYVATNSRDHNILYAYRQIVR
jgi:hypothetical protein